MTRHGIVLGAGGILGFTWSVAALHAWEQETGVDARDADVRVGTSAGSILAGLLGLGVSTDTILRHQLGTSLAEDRDVEWDYAVDGGRTRPPLPKLGLGSPGLLLSVLKHPRRIPPLAAMSGLMPRGQASLDPLERMLERLAEGVSWPERDTWIIAMDYATGDREVFGRLGSPRARLSQAVQASCSIPGWYQPVRIGRRSYVDGGALSSTSVDLLAGAGLDEVVVIAPMAARSYDRPSSALAKLERRWRRSTTKRVLQEIATVQAGDTTHVRFLCPGPADLAAMGANLMDHRRRLEVLDTALRTVHDQLADSSMRGG